MTDLPWLLELQAMSAWPDLIQYPRDDGRSFDPISGNELIRRLQESQLAP
jgi:hypothetical protein